MLTFSRDKMKARAEVGREEEGPYVTPDLSYYWEGAREWCEDNKWDEEKKCCKGKVYYYYHIQHPYPFPGFFYLYVSILLSRQKIMLTETTYFWCMQ